VPKAVVLCERSGRIRDALRRRGIEAFSCDLQPCAPSPFADFHIQDDALVVLEADDWDLVIAHPPCQFLAVSGLHWNKRDAEREAKTQAAGEFASRIWKSKAKRLCIENPRSALSRFIGRSHQRLQPNQFGADAAKETFLWLRMLPRLRPTGQHPGRIVDDGRPQLGLFGTGVERWSNQTDAGQNRLGSTVKNRADKRAETYHGVAEAMAEQWGSLLLGQ
jgi:hypothetical protein